MPGLRLRVRRIKHLGEESVGWLARLDSLLTRVIASREREEKARYDAAMRQVSGYYAMQQDHPEYYDRAATDEWWESLSEPQRDYIRRYRPLSTLPLRAAVEYYLPGYRDIKEPEVKIIGVRRVS